MFGRVGDQVGPPARDRSADQRPLGAPVQVLGDLDELLVAGEGEDPAVEGAVGLGVGRPAPGGRGADGALGQRAQVGPARGGHGTGEPEHHGDLDQGADLGQFGEFAGAPLDDSEAAVRYDLDGALGGELLHGLAHGGGGDAEPVAERGRGVHLTRGQFAAGEGGAQRVEDLAAHGGTLDDRAGPRDRRLAVRVLAAHVARAVREIPVPVHVGGARLLRHPGAPGARIREPRTGGALRALLHGSSSGRVGTWGHYGGLLLVRQAP